MDSLAECGNCTDVSVQYVVVQCISSLLSSLEKICDGSELPEPHVCIINKQYPNIQDGDYKGKCLLWYIYYIKTFLYLLCLKFFFKMYQI